MRSERRADKRRKGEIRKLLPSVRAEESAEIFRKALADYSAGKSPSDRPQALPVGTATVRHREECGTERQLRCVGILYCNSDSSKSTEPESCVRDLLARTRFAVTNNAKILKLKMSNIEHGRDWPVPTRQRVGQNYRVSLVDHL
jgi:hypothetical protein